MKGGDNMKNIPQSYFDGMYSNVTDEQELYDLELWLEDNNEDIMMEYIGKEQNVLEVKTEQMKDMQIIEIN